MSDTTLVIKTFNRPILCRRCVNSAIAQGVAPQDIVVIDDGNQHPVLPDGVTHVVRPFNSLGLSAGRNLGVLMCRTPFFMTCDDDHEFIDDTQWPVARELLKEHNLDVLGFKHKKGWLGSRMVLRGQTIHMMPPEVKIDEFLYLVDIVPNCFIAKVATLRLHRWDDKLKVHEHWEFFWRLKRVSARVAGSEYCQMLHHPGRETKLYKQHRNRRYDHYLLKKHGIRNVKW